MEKETPENHFCRDHISGTCDVCGDRVLSSSKESNLIPMVGDTKDEFELRVRDNEITRKFSPTPTVEEWKEELDTLLTDSELPIKELEYKTLRYNLETLITSLLTSHDAELARKIEKFIDENDDGMWAGRETADAVLALFTNKNV